ncbi:MAG: hypothetical protein ACR2PZ_01945 [Pseudomonadales bacterium]
MALISLVIALTSLGYNTWRNEATEANRNQRTAAFEALLQIGRLQELVFYSHYDHSAERGNPRSGWALVLTLEDLSMLLPERCQQASQKLHTQWQEHWSELGQEEQAATEILGAIDHLRDETQLLLQSLD